MGCVVLRVMLNIKEVKKFHFTFRHVKYALFLCSNRCQNSRDLTWWAVA